MDPLLILVKNMGSTKSELRRHALASRNALSAAYREACSQKITRLLCQLPEYTAASNLLLYASFGSEVDTCFIARQALTDQKKLFFPKVCENQMSFIQVTELASLEKGYRGIPEPKGSTVWDDTLYASSLLVLPGVAFDRSHHRIGYGKGFYDRFLAVCRNHNRLPHSIALSFQSQIIPHIPVESHDYLPDQILTENGAF